MQEADCPAGADKCGLCVVKGRVGERVLWCLHILYVLTRPVSHLPQFALVFCRFHLSCPESNVGHERIKSALCRLFVCGNVGWLRIASVSPNPKNTQLTVGSLLLAR